ncbi:(2Fe-2S)-binding protein [Fodinicola feengrottensis]|uniref:(2Fe-2S)-binding protein n=1 Tax=Fodinicola feengrottensis TaxID=435914 RepID=UPI0028BED475|nr:(2Fe-2S)-binding protein [Fodinicola feengrottensis]
MSVRRVSPDSRRTGSTWCRSGRSPAARSFPSAMRGGAGTPGCRSMATRWSARRFSGCPMPGRRSRSILCGVRQRRPTGWGSCSAVRCRRRASPRAGLPGCCRAAEICRCNRVTKRQLVHAWQSGARTVERLATATRATTGCGSCVDAVDGICSWLAAADTSPDSSADAELAG